MRLAPQDVPYLAQRQDTLHRVVFLAHSYLRTQLPLSGDIALQVIDEKFWSEMIDIKTLRFDRWYLVSDHIKEAGLEDLYKQVRDAVTGALESGGSVHAALAEQKVTARKLETLARREETAQPSVKVRPWQTTERMEKTIKSFDSVTADSIEARASIFRLLAQTSGRDGTERLNLKKPGKNSANELPDGAVIQSYHLKGLLATTPTILLDADLDAAIVRRFYPNVQFERLLARPNAHVVQISNRTLGTSSVVSGKEGEKIRRDIATIIKREVARAKGGNVLLVATKRVLKALQEDVGAELDETKKNTQSLYGAEVRWFGPRMLGVNTYADFSTIIFVGRLQLPTYALEDQVHAVFGDSGRPLELTKNDKLVLSSTELLRADSTSSIAKVWIHPDVRWTTLLQQTREAQSEQAIARLRLIDTTSPKRVVVLSNIPLPNLPVDELTTFDALVADKSVFQLSKKYKKLKAAISGPNKRMLPGIRLSETELKGDAPHAFPSAVSVKEFRKKLPIDKLLDWIPAIVSDLGLPAIHVQLFNGKRGGHPTPAVVFATLENAQQTSQQLWPEFDEHTVIGPIGVTKEDIDIVVEPT
jgi:hypothetical protein